MVDLFVSYAREDRASVQRLAQALEAIGWRVFWDVVIPTGKQWRDVISANLQETRCVLVILSRSRRCMQTPVATASSPA